MKHAAKSPRGNGSSNPNRPDARKDRKSGTGMSGSPKKGGHGGKFTWSGEGQFSAAEMGAERPVMVLDVKDPNFEDPDDDVDVDDREVAIQTA